MFQCVGKTCLFSFFFCFGVSLLSIMTVNYLSSLHFSYVLGRKDLFFDYFQISQGVSPNCILIKPVNYLLIFFVVIHVPFFFSSHLLSRLKEFSSIYLFFLEELYCNTDQLLYLLLCLFNFCNISLKRR